MILMMGVTFLLLLRRLFLLQDIKSSNKIEHHRKKVICNEQFVSKLNNKKKFVAAIGFNFDLSKTKQRVSQDSILDSVLFFIYIITCFVQSYTVTARKVFELNTERYGVSLRNHSQCGKIWTRKTPNMDTFNVVFKVHSC